MLELVITTLIVLFVGGIVGLVQQSLERRRFNEETNRHDTP